MTKEISMGLDVYRSDVVVGDVFEGYRGVSEYSFFEMQKANRDTTGLLPMPDGVTRWYNATYKDSPALYGDSGKGDLYLILQDARRGLALFHYVDANNTGSVYSFSPILPSRAITTRKEQNSMNPNLAALAQQVGNQRNMTPMNLQGGMPTAPVYGGMDGIASAGGDRASIKAAARAKGYVFGYVMKNAPVINAKLRAVRDTDKRIVGHDITFVQTKPSGLLRVLVAVPTRCVSHNGNVTTVENIEQGNVDFTSIDANEMTYLSMEESAAIGIIQALGGALPEWRPNVVDKADNKQWTVEEIQSSSDVSFVEPRTGKSKSKRAVNGYIIHLKSTRGMLLTQKNFMCLRALEHLRVPTRRGSNLAGNGTKSAQEEFLLNESAFGMWRFRNVREGKTDTGKTTLQVALTECPNQIWEASYENVKPNTDRDTAVIEKVENGIGSCFFAQASVPQAAENGVARAFMPGNYFPWYQGPREKDPRELDYLAFRQVVETKDGKGHRGDTRPVLWRDEPNHQMFSAYSNFADGVVSRGFMTTEELRGLGTKAGGGKGSKKKVDQNAERALKAYLQSPEVVGAMERVRDMNAQKNVRAQ